MFFQEKKMKKIEKNRGKKNIFVLQRPQRMRRFACLQDCLLTLTCHLAYLILEYAYIYTVYWWNQHTAQSPVYPSGRGGHCRNQTSNLWQTLFRSTSAQSPHERASWTICLWLLGLLAWTRNGDVGVYLDNFTFPLAFWHTSFEWHTVCLLFGLLFLGVSIVYFLSRSYVTGLWKSWTSRVWSRRHTWDTLCPNHQSVSWQDKVCRRNCTVEQFLIGQLIRCSCVKRLYVVFL